MSTMPGEEGQKKVEGERAVLSYTGSGPVDPIADAADPVTINANLRSGGMRAQSFILHPAVRVARNVLLVALIAYTGWVLWSGEHVSDTIVALVLGLTVWTTLAEWARSRVAADEAAAPVGSAGAGGSDR